MIKDTRSKSIVIHTNDGYRSEVHHSKTFLGFSICKIVYIYKNGTIVNQYVLLFRGNTIWLMKTKMLYKFIGWTTCKHFVDVDKYFEDTDTSILHIN